MDTYGQDQLYIRHLRQQALEPYICAFGPRGQVASYTFARIAESLRQYGNLRHVVKNIGAYAHPFAQALSAEVIPGKAGLMHFNTGRLAAHQYFSLLMDAYYRFGT